MAKSSSILPTMSDALLRGSNYRRGFGSVFRLHIPNYRLGFFLPIELKNFLDLYHSMESDEMPPPLDHLRAFSPWSLS